jgi:gas vesicle protein
MIHDRKKKMSAWFVAGFGLGTLAGLVSAPRSGRETPDAIASGVDRGRKYVVSLERNARKRLSDMAEPGRKMFARRKKRGGSILETAKRTKESESLRTGTQ